MSNLVQPMMTGTTIPPVHHKTPFWRSLLLWLLGGLILLIGLYFLLFWPWLSRWGATDEEVRESLPGDELIAAPIFVTTKAVTIQAPPDKVWPWIMQLGVDRGGMYSYLWVENWLMRLNVQNSDEIRPEWQTLQAGDFIRFTPKEFALNPGPGLYVSQLVPNQALTGCFGLENSPPDCGHAATWQFILKPQGENSTRLILRSRTAGTDATTAVAAAKLSQGFVFYMERKMLITLKERAESFATQ